MKTKADLVEAGFLFLEELVSVEFEDLQIFEGLAVDDHPDESHFVVKARIARRSRVDVKQVELLVVHHL